MDSVYGVNTAKWIRHSMPEYVGSLNLESIDSWWIQMHSMLFSHSIQEQYFDVCDSNVTKGGKLQGACTFWQAPYLSFRKIFSSSKSFTQPKQYN